MLYIKRIGILQHNGSSAADRQRRNLPVPVCIHTVVVNYIKIVAVPWIEAVTDIGIDFIRQAVVLDKC